VRTFTKAELARADAAWEAGGFSDEWAHIRRRAAAGGLIYPPAGSKWDTWDDDSPSQRAMLIRAIRDTPRLLDRCVIGARSWSQVLDRLLRVRDEWRDEADSTVGIYEDQKAAERGARSRTGLSRI